MSDRYRLHRDEHSELSLGSLGAPACRVDPGCGRWELSPLPYQQAPAAPIAEKVISASSSRFLAARHSRGIAQPFVMAFSILRRSSIRLCCSSTGAIVTGATKTVSGSALFETTSSAPIYPGAADKPESGLPSDRHPDRTKRAVGLEAVKVWWQRRSMPQGWCATANFDGSCAPT